MMNEFGTQSVTREIIGPASFENKGIRAENCIKWRLSKDTNYSQINAKLLIMEIGINMSLEHIY